MKNSQPLFIILLAASLCVSLARCRGPESRIEPIAPQELEAHIRFLSDDLLEGRGVGTRGHEIAVLYQEEYFRTFGLEPLFDGGFRQVFGLRGIRPDPAASMEISSGKVLISPRIFEDFVIQSERDDLPDEIAAELVYGGYLIQAPERNWDDVKRSDLKGKVILAEINEPGNYPGGIFDGEEMNYYGRWTYKFEKAAELGAAGILIVHNDRGAAYGWDVVRNSWSGESFSHSEKRPSLFFQGWIHESLAKKIFQSVHMDRREILARAERPDFSPVPLGLEIKVRQKPAFRNVAAANVAALLRSRSDEPGERSIIISAHFDHLGRNEALKGDQIYNGAVDNCSAMAAMLALAGYYAQKPRDLNVNLIFAGVTAEEHGLLGSDYLVRHLGIPNSSILANINFETTNVWGETADVFGIGAGYSDMDDICREAAGRLGLEYTPDRLARLGYFFRSDQLSFAKAGIPCVWLHEGIVSRGPDPGFVKRRFDEYLQFKYHQVTDEMEPGWDLRGTVQIIRWAQEIIAVLASRKEIPQFKPASPFGRPAGADVLSQSGVPAAE